MTNITRFRALVIMIAVSLCPLLQSESLAAPALFRLFAAVGQSVQTTKVGQAPALPQLRRSAEAGLLLLPDKHFSAALSFGAFMVDPAIPAGNILYRGYTGFSVKGAADYAFITAEESATHPFVSVGGGAALARYEQTDLAFLEYSAFIAPGLARTRAGCKFRVSLPLELEFRGDAVSFSIGLLFSINKARITLQKDTE